MTKYSIATACALTLATFGVVSTSVAGTAVAGGKESKKITETIKESCITGDLGLAVVSQYVSRGVVLKTRASSPSLTSTSTSSSMRARASLTRSP